jgi:predicted ATPase with chaperone activity
VAAEVPIASESAGERSEIPTPGSVEGTGLDLGFIANLALKIIYLNDQITAARLSDQMCLRYGNVLEPALTLLRREHLVETLSGGAQGPPRRRSSDISLSSEHLVEPSSGGTQSPLNYGYAITDKGRERVLQIMERSAYIGPAPVTLEQYVDVVKRHAIAESRVAPESVRQVMSDLVLEEHVIQAMGRAVNTGRSLFLYGPPGNGKTMLAEHIIPLLGGHVYIPHALIIDGQIIKIYDPPNHQPIERRDGAPVYDRRFVLCKRPAIVVGGELTLAALDLGYDPVSKVYTAPLQMKANGGMFLIDDFGRQLVTPQELLNRWIVPLEKRIDFLTLRTGKKIQIPFDQMIVFSTNLAPTDLVDEAFLRRIQNKIQVGNPTRAGFCEIIRRQCDALGVAFDQSGLEYLLREYYDNPGRAFRACHPRDLLRTMIGMARYDGTQPALIPPLIDQACETYFVEF